MTLIKLKNSNVIIKEKTVAKKWKLIETSEYNGFAILEDDCRNRIEVCFHCLEYEADMYLNKYFEDYEDYKENYHLYVELCESNIIKPDLEIINGKKDSSKGAPV